MKPALELRVGQQLTMTPQLQQAIKLLQLSTLDLQAAIQEQLDANLMLEVDENDAPSPDANRLADQDPDVGGDPDSIDDDSEPLASGRQNLPDELPVDVDWDTLYDGASQTHAASREAATEPEEIVGARTGEGLQAHLCWQLAMSSMSARDRCIAEVILDALEADGYLRAPLDDLLAALPKTIDVETVEAVLRRIQDFDPPGVAARSPAECLTLQLAVLPADTPFLDAARRIVRDHLESLAKGDRKTLLRRLDLGEDELAGAIALIRSLTPHPGALVDREAPEYVVPDILVSRKAGVWRVEPNPRIAPKLRINPGYAKLVRRGDAGSDNACLREHLQEARWFLKSLHGRNATLLNVAAAIVERQRAFLDRGEEAMVPLVLRDVAEAVDLHESTVSRVVAQKYMRTPRGTYEFKYFFSSHVGTSAGGECSATAIRAMIRKLCAEEPPGKPLSDNKIAQILGARGIEVARRTVAKYRESLRIPPSNERKRLG